MLITGKQWYEIKNIAPAIHAYPLNHLYVENTESLHTRILFRLENIHTCFYYNSDHPHNITSMMGNLLMYFKSRECINA